MYTRGLHSMRLVDPDRSGEKEAGVGNVRRTESSSYPVSQTLQ